MTSRLWRISVGVSLLLVWMFSACPAAAEDTLYVSLDEAVNRALDRSLGIRIARLDTRVQAASVAMEEAKFGRSLGTSVFHQTDRSPSISQLEQVETSTSNTQSVALELSQQLPTGGSIGLGFSNSRSSSNAAFRTIDPVYRSDLELWFSHPLLRGRGKINRAGLEIARNEMERAEVDLEGRLRDLTADVRVAYWNLFFARENLRVNQQLSEGARRVLEMVQARVEMGVDAENVILQAEVGVARREEDIVVAEAGVRDAEDRLKSLIGLDQDRAAWDTHLVPVETPALIPFDDDLATGIDRALSLSSDYRRAEIALSTLDLQTAIARNNMRPSVALTARAGMSGIGGTYRDDLEVLLDAGGRSWQGGLSLDVPLGTSSEREYYLRRKLERKRAEIDVENLKLQIAGQVRRAFRQVHTDRRRVEVAMLAERLAERSVSEEEDRLGLGLSTVRQVLDAQDDLAAARASRLRALVDYNNSLIEWVRITEGTEERTMR